MPKPTVGRIVHYYLDSGEADYPVPAIITAVPELLAESGPNSGPEGYVEAVYLTAFAPTGLLLLTDIPFSPEPQIGHWTWAPIA